MASAADWTIAAGTMLAAFPIFLAVIKFLTSERHRHIVDSIGITATRKEKMGYFTVEVPLWRFWNWLRRELITPPEVPSLSELIKAGDDLYFTSSMFDWIPPKNEKVSWRPLYDACFREVAWEQRIRKTTPTVNFRKTTPTGNIKSRITWERIYANSIWGALREAQKDIEQMIENQRGKSQSATTDRHLLYGEISEAADTPKNTEEETSEDVEKASMENKTTVNASTSLANCILRLPLIDTEKEQFFDVFQGKSGSESQEIWIWNGDIPCIPVSPEEIAALSLIFGMHLRLRNGILEGYGVCGTSLFGKQESETVPWNVRIMHQRRAVPKQAASKGSGFASLWATCMACGCVPFGTSDKLAHVVHVTNYTLTGIETGAKIENNMLSRDYFDGEKRQMDYLLRLPSFYRKLFYRNNGKEEEWSGPIYKDEEVKSTWAKAVAHIAFGGLVPMATLNVIRAVRFAAEGDGSLGSPNDCWSNLTSTFKKLIFQVQRKQTNLGLFGTYIELRANEKFHSHILQPSQAVYKTDLRTTAAFLARCMTMLEYIIQNIDDKGDQNEPSDKQTKVRNPNEPCDKQIKVRNACAEELEGSYKKAVDKKRKRRWIGDGDVTTTEEDLARLPAEGQEDKTYDIKDCGKVARYLILFWTYCVCIVVWDDKELREAEEFMGPGFDKTRLYYPQDIQDLPQSVLLS